MENHICALGVCPWGPPPKSRYPTSPAPPPGLPALAFMAGCPGPVAAVLPLKAQPLLDLSLLTHLI